MIVAVRVAGLVRLRRMIAFHHVYLGAGDSAAIYLLDAEGRADIERCSCVVEHLRRHAGVDQRTQEHVARDPGKAVKIDNTHHEVSLERGAEAIADAGSTSFMEPVR